MAGKIIADTIESAGSQISLNVGNVTVLTASSTGLTLIPTTNVNINLTNSTLAFGAGNVSFPSITASGDTNTGLYFPAADTIAFTEGGVESMRIDSSGNVGIGTSSPTNRLTINSVSGTSPSLLLQGQDNTERLSITSAGASGGTPVFGAFSSRGTTASPTAAQSGDALGYYQLGGYDGSAFNRSAWIQGLAAENYSATNRGSILAFSTTPNASTTIAERMRIDSSGNLLVGTTSNGRTDSNGTAIDPTGIVYQNHITGTASGSFYTRFSLAGTQIGSISQSGTTAVAYNTSSDYRLKENIAPMTGALAKVTQLKPVTYKWKEDGSDGEGFIAHELAEVKPDCVTGEKDAVDENGDIKPQGIDTSFLVATLTAAIQELKVIVDAQAVEIAALKAK